MMVGSPFIVYSMPRASSAWLSALLSYGDYACYHDQTRYVRGPDDVRSWFSQNFTGCVETAAAPWWRLVQHYRPDVRTLVVRRPVAEVVDSFLRINMRGVCVLERESLTQQMTKLDRRLAQIARCVPDAMEVSFADLRTEEGCRNVFEHCLPYQHDPAWWASLASVNLQVSVPSQMRYYHAHKKQADHATASCWNEMLRIMNAGRRRHGFNDGVTIQEERFEDFWRDGQTIFTEHCDAIGEDDSAFLDANLPLWRTLDQIGSSLILTARLNGRMIGYRAAIVGPTLQAADITSAMTNVFFVSRDAKGMSLGLRLERAMIEAVRARGADEILGRAGIRGSGPKLDILYRRLGFEEYGRLYRLPLKRA